jgi:phage terminase small subunit
VTEDKDVLEAREIMKIKQGRPRHDAEHKAELRERASERLTDKDKKAVEMFFLCEGNRSEAARRLGFGASYSWYLFKQPVVKKEIERRQAILARKYEVSAERVIEETAFIAFSNLGDLLVTQADGSAIIDMNKLTPQMRAAISEYTVETFSEGRGKDAKEVKKYRVKFHDKKAALDSLARTMGLFNDKVTIGLEDEMIEALQAGRKRAAIAGDNAKVIDHE